MTESESVAAQALPEFPNLVTLLHEHWPENLFFQFLHHWESLVFSILAAVLLLALGHVATRRREMVPGRLQGAAEVLVGAVDDFVCSVLGPQGRKFTPFIGTLFLYIFFMNLMGLVPLLKSPTADLSVTLALAIVVFFFVQITAFRGLGLFGYADHMMGQPRGFLAFSVILPAFMFVLHFIGEFVRPLSLSMRLRSNVWGDDLLLATIAGFGLQGVPLLLLNTIMTLVASTVQALVFTLLTLIYLALVMPHDTKHDPIKTGG
ncbi:MAG: F0F1 ATP synthase subunit A [Elusimicrobia bacterium]|nr:F0F1 ATP synthase subunit A [Elusimicrobiota bacterium]